LKKKAGRSKGSAGDRAFQLVPWWSLFRCFPSRRERTQSRHSHS
jgi:hypothetical protein